MGVAISRRHLGHRALQPVGVEAAEAAAGHLETAGGSILVRLGIDGPRREDDRQDAHDHGNSDGRAAHPASFARRCARRAAAVDRVGVGRSRSGNGDVVERSCAPPGSKAESRDRNEPAS
jgi:hypothetical protein